MPSRFIYVVGDNRISFFLIAQLYFIVYVHTTFSLSIHPSGDIISRHVAIRNNAAMNIGVLIISETVISFILDILRGGMAGSSGSPWVSWGTSILFFKLYQFTFPPPVYKRSPFAPPPRWLLLSLIFWVEAVLTQVRWCRTVVLICISPTVSDIEHLVMFLLAICMLSSERRLFRSFAYFFLFSFLLLSWMSSLCILDINCLSDIWLANTFSWPIGCLFTLLIVFLAVKKPF